MRLSGTMLVVAIAVALMSGCGPGGDDDKPTYDPMPDEELYSEIEALDGVQQVDIRFVEGFARTNNYGGELTVTDPDRALELLDRAIAILWQGREGALADLLVLGPDRQLLHYTSDLGLRKPADYEERYGPQPGTGEPPEGSVGEPI
jgi:hypothetical protein